jgi:hypothetical protein
VYTPGSPQNLLRKKANRVVEDVKKSLVLDKKSYTKAMVQYFYYLVTGLNHKLDKLHRYVFDMEADFLKREIIESLLLSKADPDEIEAVFGITPDMVEIYSEMFFDLDNLVSKLDIVSYLENYPDEAGKALKIRAYNLGPEFVYFRYGNITPSSVNQGKLVKKLFLTSAYKAMEANYSSVSANNTKAASAHASTMLKAYEAIKKLVEDSDQPNGAMLYKVFVAEDDPKAQPKHAVNKDDIV